MFTLRSLCIDILHQVRHDLYLGDQPIPYKNKPQTATNPLKAMERIDELKNHRKTQESKKRNGKRNRKLAQRKSLSKLPAATRLNETAVSQLDISCAKALGRRPTKAPLIEHAFIAKYARSATFIKTIQI